MLCSGSTSRYWIGERRSTFWIPRLCLTIFHQPSAKVAIIRFKRGMQQGLLGRISRSSIMEYHVFGIISWALSIFYKWVRSITCCYSESRHAKYHYMVAGVQGMLIQLLEKFLQIVTRHPRRFHSQSCNESTQDALDSGAKGMNRTCGWILSPCELYILFQFAGVSNTSTLYKRGIRICTGTGIGAALSTCLQSPYW